MNRNSYRSICLICLSAVLICILLQACANKGYPEGGPKDVTPPKVIAEVPASFNTNFKKKSVNIYFDEFVQLKNVQEKFIISPPQAKKPRVRLRAKYIMVEFEDTLRPNTTYSLDFADAIVDNNEGNPLGYYRYVFSTGNTLDSLELWSMHKRMSLSLVLMFFFIRSIGIPCLFYNCLIILRVPTVPVFSG